MATITANEYNDSSARTAGETITINNGAVWTVRTDYRVHANAPASNLGSLASITINEGECKWDSTNVRWLAYNSGSGNVPAIGTSIVQGSVSGYLLGVWASKTVAQTAVGAAMPASGFIKLREVTGGTYASGALTGIGASATGADVQGWISLPHDVAGNFTVPRLGKFTARGGRFFLENTTGVVGQILQVPTDGSAVMYAPGVWIETGVGTDIYEYYPGLYSSTNGWASQHIGEAKGSQDARQKFVKILAGGQLQIGEDSNLSATYASLAAQASTYAAIASSCTYTWANDIIEINYGTTAHGLDVGQSIGLDFTTGSATDGSYTIVETPSPYYVRVSSSGSGTGGNVTVRPGVAVTFTSHALNVGEQVYLDATSGTLPDGTYTIYAVTSANVYNVSYPTTSAVTGGNANAIHTLVVTYTSHGLALGNKVYLDFTSGTGVDGEYTIKTVAANTLNVNFPHSATTSGNVTVKRQIGYVPVSGCRTWIPSNILNEVATAARATNTVPNATIASRPEFITTSAGAIDLEYVYGCSGFPSFSQPYSLRIHHCAFFDQITISECATALDINDLNTSMQGALDVVSFTLSTNYAGGEVSNCRFERGNTPGTADNSVYIGLCTGITLNNVQSGIIQYVRSTGYPFQLTSNNYITMNNCRAINGTVAITTCFNTTINDLDYCDRYTGRTNLTSPYYLFTITTLSMNIKIDGLTFGFNGSIQDCHPVGGIISTSTTYGLKVRNIGTFLSPLSGGTWAKNTYGMGYVFYSAGANINVKYQKCFVDNIRVTSYNSVNSDKNITFESISGGMWLWGTKVINSIAHSELNSHSRGVNEINSLTGQASVYGSHFIDLFMGTGYGRYVLNFNEPTTETESQFSMITGTRKFNSSGGLLLSTPGWECEITDEILRLGHTGFHIEEPLVTGPTLYRHEMQYQIDKGSGFSSWKNYYRMGSNLYTIYNSSTISYFHYHDSCKITSEDSNNHFVLLAYEDATFYLKCRITKIVGDNTDKGVEYTITSASATYCSLTKLTDTTFLVTYISGTYVRARVLTVNTATREIVAGNELAVNSDANSTYPTVVALSSTQAVLVYRGTASFYLQCCTLNISGTTVTNGTIVSLNSVSSTHFALDKISSTQAICAFQGSASYGSSCIITVNGTDVSAGSFTTLDASSTYFQVKVISSTQAVCTFVGASTYLYGCVLDISGTTISKGTTATIRSTGFNTNSLGIISSTKLVAVGYCSSTYLSGSVITVNGSTLDVGTYINFEIPTGTVATRVAMLTSSKFLVSFDWASDYLNGEVVTIYNDEECLPHSSGTSGQYTIKCRRFDKVAVGDYVWGTGIGSGAKVTDITGNVITLDVANSGTVSGTLRFSQLPSEVIDPSVGFRLKVKITTLVEETVAMTCLRSTTTSSITAQQNYYPLDTVNLTVSGLISGSDVVIYEAGTTNVLDTVDEVAATSWNYVYEAADVIDIGIFKAGYVPYYVRNLSISTTDSSIPVAQVVDRAYLQ